MMPAHFLFVLIALSIWPNKKILFLVKRNFVLSWSSEKKRGTGDLAASFHMQTPWEIVFLNDSCITARLILVSGIRPPWELSFWPMGRDGQIKTMRMDGYGFWDCFIIKKGPDPSQRFRGLICKQIQKNRKKSNNRLHCSHIGA